MQNLTPTLQTIRTRVALAQLIPTTGRAVELGVAKGTFSDALLRARPGFRLVSIDSWADDERGHGDEEFEQAKKLLGAHGARSIVMRKTFRDALDFFPHGSLDFVYIDGYAHTGQDNGATLRAWWPKVRAGGIFAGHDYHPRWPETVGQVDTFFHNLGLKFGLTPDDEFPSWWVRK
jgi:predicted O-methyltransferase YrrM